MIEFEDTDYLIIRTPRFTEEEYQEIKDLICQVLRRKEKNEKRIIEEMNFGKFNQMFDEKW